ncbi:MAG: hypothetical protein ACM3MG_02735 [Bacillota bacterium]
MDAAHIHLMLNHIPVLGGVATLCLVALADLKEDKTLGKLSLQLMVLIAILTLPVYFTGEPAEKIIEHLPGVAESFIEEHEKFANFALGLTELLGIIGLVGLYSFRKNPNSIKQYWRSIQIIALVNVMIMVAVANLGGQIRHTEIRKADSASQAPGGIQSPTSEHDD